MNSITNGPEAAEAAKPSGSELSHWLRTWRYLFWSLGIVLVVVLFYAEENWRGQHAWEKYRREAAARGQPVDSADVIPPQAADVENFAVTPFLTAILQVKPGGQSAAEGDMTAEQKFAFWFNKASNELKPVKEVRSNSWVKACTDLQAWCNAFQQVTNRAEEDKAKEYARRYGIRPQSTTSTASPGYAPAKPNPPAGPPHLTPQEAAVGVLAGLSDCQQVLEELREASHRPASHFKLDYTTDNPAAMLLPHLAPLKRVSQVLLLKAAAELARGRTNEAFEDVTLMLRLCEACRDEPILISHLVRLAQFQIALQPFAEGLASHAWSEPQLRAVQERLQRLDFCADARRVLHGERVLFGCGMIDYARRSRIEFSRFVDSGPLPPWLGPVMRIAPAGWFSFEKVNLCRMLDETILQTIDVAGHQIHAGHIVKTEQRPNESPGGPPAARFFEHRIFAAMFVPGVARTAHRTAFAQTAVDLATIACALERYRLAQGQFPENLAALVPQFIERVPNDIINGQPLKYRRTPDGQFLLYSVGWNETDDGGTVVMNQNGQFANPDTSGGSANPDQGDWVWRNIGAGEAVGP